MESLVRRPYVAVPCSKHEVTHALVDRPTSQIVNFRLPEPYQDLVTAHLGSFVSLHMAVTDATGSTLVLEFEPGTGALKIHVSCAQRPLCVVMHRA